MYFLTTTASRPSLPVIIFDGVSGRWTVFLIMKNDIVRGPESYIPMFLIHPPVAGLAGSSTHFSNTRSAAWLISRRDATSESEGFGLMISITHWPSSDLVRQRCLRSCYFEINVFRQKYRCSIGKEACKGTLGRGHLGPSARYRAIGLGSAKHRNS